MNTDTILTGKERRAIKTIRKSEHNVCYAFGSEIFQLMTTNDESLQYANILQPTAESTVEEKSLSENEPQKRQH